MRICVDTGLFFGLYDPRDEASRRNDARKFFDRFFDPDRSNNQMILVWPILYESLNTRFVKNQLGIENFSRDLSILQKADRLVFVDDAKYRDACYNSLTTEPDRRPLSLVDRVLRSFLQDRRTQVDALFTFNHRDFLDIHRKNFRLLPEI